ncbi:MAG: PTS sugar transporter subunit IIA [Vibrio sp.]
MPRTDSTYSQETTQKASLSALSQTACLPKPYCQRITFFLGADGLPSWLIKSIHQQVFRFQGQVELVKVQSLQSVNIKDYLTAMTLAFSPFELCQIVINGNTADLESEREYAKQLRLFLHQHCFVIEPLRIKADSINKTASVNSLFQMQVCNIDATLQRFIKLYQSISKQALKPDDPQDLVIKQFCLQKIAHLAQSKDDEVIEHKLNKREIISSTGMRNGVAVPHILCDEISQPKVIILTSSEPVHWGSKFGDVTHIIAILLPKTAPSNAFLAVRNLVMAFVNPEMNQFICQHQDESELCAIITSLMKLDSI